MSSKNGVEITWLGHSTVLIRSSQGTHILIDPFIAGNPKYPKGFELPEKIDFILLTHGHGDHISDAVPVANNHGSTVVAIYELAAYIEKKGAPKTIGINLGGAVQLNDVLATFVEAKHSSAAEDEDGTHYVGVAGGYILQIPGTPTLYHAGDTTVFGDMRLIGELYRPELAMLPIGGYYTMGPELAAKATALLGANKVLPLHFGTFPPITGTPDQLAALVNRDVEVLRCSPGDSFSL